MTPDKAVCQVVEVKNHFKIFVEILDTDGAGDERKCARLLSAAVFKNCKATVRRLVAVYL